MPTFNPLLDLPAFPADGYAQLADRLKRLLATKHDLIFVQAEAILALEAAATSLGRPGLAAVNVVTSPYGGYFGQWLARTGANVTEVRAEAGRPVAAATVAATLDALPRVDLVALVHAETSSGIVNPLTEVAALAKARGALLIVDAVASCGGHSLDPDGLGIDVCVFGPQKALGGPAGVSMLAVSEAAWTAMGAAPRRSPSSLSLLDVKHNWLDRGRGVLPGMPSALEFWALAAALDEVEAEGLSRRIVRHALAASASRAGLRAMGLPPWVERDADASHLATAAPVPAGIGVDVLVAAAAKLGTSLTPGFGDVRDRLVRLDHAASRACFASVLAGVVGYGAALGALGHPADIGAAAAAVVATYAERN
jgi:aspartate aminotransferase-like enzyme